MLDAALGIGTQALGLLALSFGVTGSDLSVGAVTRACKGATVLKSSYLAIPVDHVAGLMRAVGFEDVRRVDGRFFQPVLVGTRTLHSLLLRADQVIE